MASAVREYLLVDGYNIIFSWDELNELAKINIDSARGKLLDILCDYQGSRGTEVIAVFGAGTPDGGDGLPQHSCSLYERGGDS